MAQHHHPHDGPCDHDHDHDHDDHDHGHDETMRLPTVFLAPDDELVELVAANTEFAKVQLTIDFVGDGRPVDDEGSLSSDDLEALGALLAVEDADDTTETIHLLAAAGLLEVADGSVVVTEAGRGAAESPLETWNEVFGAYLGRVADSVGEGPVAELIELTVTQALLLLYCEPEPVARKDLLGATWQTVRKAIDGTFDLKQDQVRKAMKDPVEETVTQVTEGMVSMGAARTVGDDEAHVTLSPLGVWGARQLFLDGPFEAPVVGDLQVEDADVLLDGLIDMRPDAADAELRLWCSTRGEANAAKELVAAAHTATSADQAMMAIHALGSIDSVAESAIRELLDVAQLKPLAYAWLVDNGHEQLPALDPSGDLAELIDTMSLWLAVGGPARLAQGLAATGPAAQQIALVERLWRVDGPYTTAVLDAIAEGHPDKPVAKAARKALFKRKSAGQA
jgi:hypothetical protein